jgi:uncharacterized protein (TIGR00288 family)
MADVAFFLDFENLLRALEERQPNRQLEVEGLLAAVSRYGRLALKRAYADWSDPKLRSYRSELLEHGVELSQCSGPARGHGAEIRLAIDAVEALFQHRHLVTFVVASGDTDFTSLVQRLKEHGKQTVVVAPRTGSLAALRSAADVFLPYAELSDGAPPAPHVEEERRFLPVSREAKPVPIGPHRRIRLHGTAIPLFSAEIRKSVIDGLYEAFRDEEGVDVRQAISEVAQRAEGQYDQYVVERIQQTLYYAKAFVLRGGMHDATLAGDISSSDDLHRRYDRHLAMLLSKEYPALDGESIAELLCEDPRQASYIRELLAEGAEEGAAVAER